ncbi:TIR domain-containing protein [Actinokineospora sp. 24-640]
MTHTSRTLLSYTRHRCFISYHQADEEEVQRFVDTFDHTNDVFISRGIGASMPGDIIDSWDPDYIKSRIRQLYLNTSTVTIVMIGKCTWARRFVDWEIAASLRNTVNSSRNGLMAIRLPSVAHYNPNLPPRLHDNLTENQGERYARYYDVPSSAADLAGYIDDAYRARTMRAQSATNTRLLFDHNRKCP